jgi:MCP family monocarboxylic acid transporter-like MFS transporter 10
MVIPAAFFIETIVWGFPNSFGVFLEAYLADETYASQKNARSVLPLIGPLSSGIMYTSGVFIQPVLARYPHWKKASLVLGAAVCFASLFGASYSTNVRYILSLSLSFTCYTYFLQSVIPNPSTSPAIIR